MKTLGQLQNQIRGVSNAYVLVALSKKRDQAPAVAFAEEQESVLFASLAQWDAVLAECLPALKAEYEGLKALRDHGSIAKVDAACIKVGWNEDNSPKYCLTGYGLARLEHLRRILGEGE